jgi:hypothetical protein
MCQQKDLLHLETLNQMLMIRINVNEMIQSSIFSAFMMTNLINDLLDLGKLENNAF